VPEDLVAGLMETAERDFRRGVCTENLIRVDEVTESPKLEE
jgi:hypothetical protein